MASIKLSEDKLKAMEIEFVGYREESEKKLKEEVERAEGRVREKVRVEVSKLLENLMQTHYKGMTFRPQSPTADIKQFLNDYTVQISTLNLGKGSKIENEQIKNLQQSWDLVTERFQGALVKFKS